MPSAIEVSLAGLRNLPTGLHQTSSKGLKVRPPFLPTHSS